MIFIFFGTSLAQLEAKLAQRLRFLKIPLDSLSMMMMTICFNEATRLLESSGKTFLSAGSGWGLGSWLRKEGECHQTWYDLLTSYSEALCMLT